MNSADTLTIAYAEGARYQSWCIARPGDTKNRTACSCVVGSEIRGPWQTRDTGLPTDTKAPALYAYMQATGLRLCAKCLKAHYANRNKQDAQGTSEWRAQSREVRQSGTADHLAHNSRRHNNLTGRSDDWRYARATERQIEYLHSQGVYEPLMEAWTRGRAADEIQRIRDGAKVVTP